MGLRIIKAVDLNEQIKERILIYGRAGIGKSRFALSLTPRFGKIAYYAADTNSEFLSSISPEKHKRILVVKPEKDDAIKNFTKFCRTDWKKIDPEIKTLVVDTYSKVAFDAIRYSANSGAVTNEKHYVVGDPQEGGQVIPNRGDYLGIESLSKGFLDLLFEFQSDNHIIFIHHEDIKVVEGISIMGGPSHPGRHMLEYLPAQFNTVIHLIRDSVLVPGANAPEDVVIAVGENDGKFIAKMRTRNETDANPLARVVVERNSDSYWIKYDAEYLINSNPGKEYVEAK